jgi:hypothetical protein
MTVLCPRCEINEYTPYGERWDGPASGPPPPALSRTTRGEEDEPVYVCSDCGQEEGMEDFFQGGATPQSEWPVKAVRHPAFGVGTTVRQPEGVRGPYGTNEGDKWLAPGSEIQRRLDAQGEGLVLIHEIIDGEEKLYTTALPDLIAEAQAGHREREAEQARNN